MGSNPLPVNRVVAVKSQTIENLGGQVSTEVEFELIDPAAPGSNHASANELFNSALFMQWTEKKLNEVDSTHLELASGKLVLKKALENPYLVKIC